jgi:carbamoyl-phosphate synthase large subunit
MQCFRQSMQELRLDGRLYAADCSATAPGFHLADRSWLVPRCTDGEFLSTISQLARSQEIRLITPTIDTELPMLSRLRPVLLKEGTWISVSDPETVEICADKVRTNAWLREHGFPTIRQAPLRRVQANPEAWPLPLIVKPRAGSASIGVRLISDRNELANLTDPTGELIVEELAPGREHTLNVYVDRHGRCRCVVPHERLEVRGGEVSKGITVKHRGMQELGAQIAEALPGARGALNVQCFLADDGQIRVVEINARFGGGYPLAHHAGAPFTSWLLREALDGPVADCSDWRGDVAMLRYDHAVFTSAAEVRAQ